MRHYVLTFDDGLTLVINRAEMGEKFAGSNLFDAGIPWENGHFQLPTLDAVLGTILIGEAWTCDNCTVEIAAFEKVQA